MNRLAALLLSALLVPLSALGDPPGRVGRLSLVEGEASVFADPELGWQAARINTPLTSENSVWTEPGARAEIRFGAVALRLGEATQLDIHQLDDFAFRGHVARGALTARIREFDPGETFTVTTPEAASSCAATAAIASTPASAAANRASRSSRGTRGSRRPAAPSASTPAAASA